jgi:hypothetical protein
VMRRSEALLVKAYLYAKRDVLRSPYGAELLQVFPNPQEISESHFLREYAWVVMSAGMSEAVVRQKFPEVARSFFFWESARCIANNAAECVEAGLCHFHHRGKICAIADTAAIIASSPFETVKEAVLLDPIIRLQAFPYIGPTTAYHLAKNLGVRVAKPDRHLVRLAASAGFVRVDEFCDCIASFLNEDVRVVDSTLWRFATIHRDYLLRFSEFASA